MEDKNIKKGSKLIFLHGFTSSTCELVEVIEERKDRKGYYCIRLKDGGTDTTSSKFLMEIPEGLAAQPDPIKEDSDRIRLLQYASLREHFNKMVKDIMGENYYNMGCDVYDGDKFCCEDITRKAQRRWWDIFR